MEVLPAGDFPQLQQPGRLPPSLSTLLPLSSGSSGSGGSGERSFSLSTLLESSGSCQSGDHGCSNVAKAYLVGAPPSSAPAQEMTDTDKRRVLRANPKRFLEQCKKYARVALEHYNKRRKIKYELVDAMSINSMSEAPNFYAHVNFTARSSKEGSQEEFFFAELQHCGKRQSPSRFLVIYCEPLGPDYTVGHRGFKLEDGSVVRKNVDFRRCFACSPSMLHPKGEKYIGGHCNIPYIYDTPC